MGECGCGATELNYQLKGPEGITYGIEVYSGCHDCGTPAGVVIHRFGGEDEWEADLLEYVPELPIVGYKTSIGGQAAITVISPEGLVASINKNLDEYGFHLRGTAELGRLVEDAVYESREGAGVV